MKVILKCFQCLLSFKYQVQNLFNIYEIEKFSGCYKIFKYNFISYVEKSYYTNVILRITVYFKRLLLVVYCLQFMVLFISQKTSGLIILPWLKEEKKLQSKRQLITDSDTGGSFSNTSGPFKILKQSVLKLLKCHSASSLAEVVLIFSFKRTMLMTDFPTFFLSFFFFSFLFFSSSCQYFFLRSQFWEELQVHDHNCVWRIQSQVFYFCIDVFGNEACSHMGDLASYIYQLNISIHFQNYESIEITLL